MIDIRRTCSDPRASRLSNFTSRSFVFSGIPCAGIEGVLQAFKCPDYETQKEICALHGKEAKRRGKSFDGWKESQTLWWDGLPYERSSREYLLLVTRVYDTTYAQDQTFGDDLLLIAYEDIAHSIGNPDMRDTVLTEVEMLYQLNRLRIHALRDRR